MEFTEDLVSPEWQRGCSKVTLDSVIIDPPDMKDMIALAGQKEKVNNKLQKLCVSLNTAAVMSGATPAYLQKLFSETNETYIRELRDALEDLSRFDGDAPNYSRDNQFSSYRDYYT